MLNNITYFSFIQFSLTAEKKLLEFSKLRDALVLIFINVALRKAFHTATYLRDLS